MFCAGAGGDDQHGNFPGDGILAQMGHQFVTVHARHFEVGDDQVAADLRDDFRSFQTIGGEFHAIAGLFEHASDEFAHADGIVGDDDYPIVFDRVHGSGGNAARGYRFRAWSENAGGGRRGGQRVAFGGVRGGEAIQINQENQAAIGRDSGSGEKFYAAEIIAEVLDYDFVLTENFFDYHAHLFTRDFDDDHVEIAVEGFERRQRQLDVEADDFGAHVAPAGKKLSADIFDFAGLEAANFFDDSQRQSKDGCAAAHEERLRDDQGERNFYGEGGTVTGFRADFDFTVQGVHVGADYVEADAAAGKLRHGSGSGEAGAEKKFAELAFGKLGGGDGRHGAHFDDAAAGAIVINAAAVVFDFDEDVVAAMIGADADEALFGFAIALAGAAVFDAVRDGVAHQVNQRIGNVLNNIVVEFGVRAFEGEFDELAGGVGGIAHGAGKARIEISDGHHARGGDFVLEVVGELGGFVDIGVHTTHEAFELGEDDIDVRGNFSERAGKNIDVVVAVHFQFAEFEQVVGSDSGHAQEIRTEGVHLRGMASGDERRLDFAEFVFLLEFGNFSGQAALREIQDFDEFGELSETADHACAIDDELADGVHHAVQALERDAHGFGLWQSFGGGAGVFWGG